MGLGTFGRKWKRERRGEQQREERTGFLKRAIEHTEEGKREDKKECT